MPTEIVWANLDENSLTLLLVNGKAPKHGVCFPLGLRCSPNRFVLDTIEGISLVNPDGSELKLTDLEMETDADEPVFRPKPDGGDNSR